MTSTEPLISGATMIHRTLTSPIAIRGNVPGLLVRGMPVHWRDEETPYIVTWAAPICDDDPVGNWNVLAAPETEPCLGVLDAASNFSVDWSSPVALYAALHWLSARGHDCWWMRPAEVGGRTADWNEAAILVSVSVGRVVVGLAPVYCLLPPWRHDPNPGDAYEEWGWTAWQRDGVGGRGAARVYVPNRTKPLLWRGAGWFYYRERYGGVAPTRNGYETGEAGRAAADAAALSDGAALRVEGGVMVGVPDGA